MKMGVGGQEIPSRATGTLAADARKQEGEL